jgi:hypothetical protein
MAIRSEPDRQSLHRRIRRFRRIERECGDAPGVCPDARHRTPLDALPRIVATQSEHPSSTTPNRDPADAAVIERTNRERATNPVSCDSRPGIDSAPPLHVSCPQASPRRCDRRIGPAPHGAHNTGSAA